MLDKPTYIVHKVKAPLDYYSPMIFLWSIFLLAAQYVEIAMLKGQMLEPSSELRNGIISNIIAGITFKTLFAFLTMVTAVFYS